MPALPAILAGALIAGVHVASPLLRHLSEVPRSRALSLAGGMGVSYVVLAVLPALGREHLDLLGSGRPVLDGLPDPVYLSVLVSLVGYYVLDRVVRSRQLTARRRQGQPRISRRLFGIQVAAFALLNVCVGLALPGRLSGGATNLWLFAIAMALKAVVIDHALQADHVAAHARVGRWLLAAGVLLGLVLGVAVTLPPLGTALLRGFIAGAVVLNLVKEELPAERKSRPLLFAAGAATYALVLLVA